jgi:hypothetical protein
MGYRGYRPRSSIDLFLDREDGGEIFLWKAGWPSTNYTALHPRRRNCSRPLNRLRSWPYCLKLRRFDWRIWAVHPRHSARRPGEKREPLIRNKHFWNVCRMRNGHVASQLGRQCSYVNLCPLSVSKARSCLTDAVGNETWISPNKEGSGRGQLLTMN